MTHEPESRVLICALNCSVSSARTLFTVQDKKPDMDSVNLAASLSYLCDDNLALELFWVTSLYIRAEIVVMYVYKSSHKERINDTAMSYLVSEQSWDNFWWLLVLHQSNINLEPALQILVFDYFFFQFILWAHQLRFKCIFSHIIKLAKDLIYNTRAYIRKCGQQMDQKQVWLNRDMKVVICERMKKDVLEPKVLRFGQGLIIM